MRRVNKYNEYHLPVDEEGTKFLLLAKDAKSGNYEILIDNIDTVDMRRIMEVTCLKNLVIRELLIDLADTAAYKED